MVFDAALDDCEKALKIDPKFVKAHARRGYCYIGLKKLHRAVDCFQAGLEIDPNDKQCIQGMRETQAAIQKNMMNGPNEEQQKRALEVRRFHAYYCHQYYWRVNCF